MTWCVTALRSSSRTPGTRHETATRGRKLYDAIVESADRVTSGDESIGKTRQSRDVMVLCADDDQTSKRRDGNNVRKIALPPARSGLVLRRLRKRNELS